MTDEIAPTDYQDRVLAYPPEVNIAALGGRGSGKTRLIGFESLRTSEQDRESARMLFVRQTYGGLKDFEDDTRVLFGAAYEGAARYNQSEHIWKLPTGATLELSQCQSPVDLQKFQGRNKTRIYVDECGQYSDPRLLDMLAANLRGPKGIAVRRIYSANPGSTGQSWLYRRYIAGRDPWKPFKDEFGAWWVYCPSTLRDNPYLDHQAYESQLRSSCAHDPELLKALLDGSFMSQTGAFFGNCFDERRCVVDRFKEIPETHRERWRAWIAMDWGSAAPCVVYLIVESPGAEYAGRFYPRGSLIAVDEVAAVMPGSLNQGLNWNTKKTSEAIIEMCALWGVYASGVADDSCFARHGHNTGSIAEEFQRCGVYFTPAQKGSRVHGWQKMRQLFANCGALDRPGLYLTRACTYALETIPFISRDPKKPDDLDSSGPDHGADALRYGCLRMTPATRIDIGLAYY